MMPQCQSVMADKKKKKMNKTCKIILGITMNILLVVVLCLVPISSASTVTQAADFTEGGHLETDFNVNFMAEWWYLNGKATLVTSEGEEKEIGFFVTLAHQESPIIVNTNGTQLSHLLTFYGLYFDNGTTTFNSTESYIPQTTVGNYIALHTSYVDYVYPDGVKRFNGSALSDYNLNYTSNGMVMDLIFRPEVEKTIDQAGCPLNFTTYEYSYGTINGSILLDGKRYNVSDGEGYMDHMIPIGSRPWPMEMHGWSWFEVTTKNYQVIAYAVRGLDDGYDDYSYKHLTLLDKHDENVRAEYSADEITITESDWLNESEFNRKRPSNVVFSTLDRNVTVSAEITIYFTRSDPKNATGFVDFMAFQPDNAAIQYNGNVESGSAFYEYLVSDRGVITPTVKIFDMPELDIQKTYTYNITFDQMFPDRIGTEAVLYWGEKGEIDGIDYSVSNLSKLDGGEVQYLGIDTENEDITLKGIVDRKGSITFMNFTYELESVFIDYPLYVGKTWDRAEVNFSGMGWIGYPVYVNGTTWGSAVVTGEEDIEVPAGVAHCLVLEMLMNSTMTYNGTEKTMNTSQKVWLMENGFFAKRMMYHEGVLMEILDLVG
jgi:hypothetical protein